MWATDKSYKLVKISFKRAIPLGENINPDITKYFLSHEAI